MITDRFCRIIAALFVMAFAVPVYADSYYPLRPEDPQAVYLTKDQFGVHADGVGVDSDVLQEAINQVQEKTRVGVLFIPSGRYRLDKTVFVWQGIRLIGYGPERPVFVLGRNTPGFQEGTGKYMLHFADYRPRQNMPFSDGSEFTFYSGMNNIDIEIEDGNPAAIAVRFHVAQHSYLRHMNFHVGDARAAIEDIGNQISDIKVYGGKYGIISKRTAPVWPFLLMDSGFERQSEAAIHTMEAGFTLVRIRFAHMPVAIQIAPGEVEQLYGRDLRMEDIRTAAFKHGNAGNPHSEVTLTNVACSDVPYFFRGDQPIAAPSQHYMVDRFTYGLEIGEDGRERGIVMGHRKHALQNAAMLPESDIPALPPMETWVNVRSLNVKGDGKTDDTEALRAAIDRYQALYFPGGTYRVTGSLQLKPDTVLIGLNPGHTSIELSDDAPAFGGEGEPVGILVAPKGGRNIVSSITVRPGVGNPRAAGVIWMAGSGSMLDDVSFPGSGFGVENADTQGPDLWIKDGGGGIFRGNWPHGTISQVGLRIENTENPGKIYQMSVEHHMRFESQFHNIKNWEFYAYQTEEEHPAGARAVAMDIRDCENLLFANTYMYRVSRSIYPKTNAAEIRNSSNIQFENVKVFSQTRLAFDNSVMDEESGVAVRSQFFTNFVVNKEMKALKEIPLPAAIFDTDAKLEKLATGFNNASGLTTDSAGRLFFTDGTNHKIYRWNDTDKKAEPIGEIEGRPMVMGFVEPSTLLFVAHEKEVYSLKADETGAAPQKIEETPEKLPGTALLLPVGLHNMLPILHDLMEHRDYAYRWGSNTAVVGVEEGAHRGYFYAPGTKTAVMAGGTWRPLLQSSSLAAFSPGDERFITSEDDGKTYRAKLGNDWRLTSSVFAERGGTSVISDNAGNVYIASGQIYIYDLEGSQIGILELPERPGSLAFGGPDKRTLFIGARGSLYSIRTKTGSSPAKNN